MRDLLSATLVAIAAFGLIGAGALADDNEKKNAPVINQVVVNFEDAAFDYKDTLTIIGRNLAGRPGKRAAVVFKAT